MKWRLQTNHNQTMWNIFSDGSNGRFLIEKNKVNDEIEETILDAENCVDIKNEAIDGLSRTEDVDNYSNESDGQLIIDESNEIDDDNEIDDNNENDDVGEINEGVEIDNMDISENNASFPVKATFGNENNNEETEFEYINQHENSGIAQNIYINAETTSINIHNYPHYDNIPNQSCYQLAHNNPLFQIAQNIPNSRLVQNFPLGQKNPNVQIYPNLPVDHHLYPRGSRFTGPPQGLPSIDRARLLPLQGSTRGNLPAGLPIFQSNPILDNFSSLPVLQDGQNLQNLQNPQVFGTNQNYENDDIQKVSILQADQNLVPLENQQNPLTAEANENKESGESSSIVI